MSAMEPPVSRDMSLLAPGFRNAVEAVIAACTARGDSIKVVEAYRSEARQRWLYDSSRPPNAGPWLTNAASAYTSWHGYGLAIDFCHATLGWKPHGDDEARNQGWFKDVADVFKAQGCNWGGDFHKHPDTAHIQWGCCEPSPTPSAQVLIRTEGPEAVWKALKAL